MSEEPKTTRSRFQTLKKTLSNDVPSSILTANDNVNHLFTFTNEPPLSLSMTPDRYTYYNNSNLEDTINSNLKSKRRIDDEINHFTKDMDWKPRSKQSNNVMDSKEENTLMLRNNLDKKFKTKTPSSENPFVKNLVNNSNSSQYNNTIKRNQTTSSNNNINSKPSISSEEVKSLSNKLRFMSDSNIKNMDNLLLSELKTLSSVVKNIIDKAV